MSTKLSSHDVAFVLRCAIAATLSYSLSSQAGLASPAWASISAIIVSQEKLGQTGSALAWRFVGTIVGIVVAISTDILTRTLHVDVAVQMGLAVAVCATLVRRWPDLKVAMWTVPIVYLANTSNQPLLALSYSRCSEVLVGGLVGLAVHCIAEGFLHLYEFHQHIAICSSGSPYIGSEFSRSSRGSGSNRTGKSIQGLLLTWRKSIKARNAVGTWRRPG